MIGSKSIFVKPKSQPVEWEGIHMWQFIILVATLPLTAALLWDIAMFALYNIGNLNDPGDVRMFFLRHYWLLFVPFTVGWTYILARSGYKSLPFIAFSLFLAYFIHWNMRGIAVWPGTFDKIDYGLANFFLSLVASSVLGTGLGLAVHNKKAAPLLMPDAFMTTYIASSLLLSGLSTWIVNTYPANSMFTPTRHIFALILFAAALICYIIIERTER